MRRRLFQGLTLFFVLLFLTGCNPFTTNIFSGIDKYKMPDLGDVDELLASADDPAFFDNLKDSSSDKEKVLETLEDAYTDSSVDDETRMEAALLAADVHLKTSGTDDTMDNFNQLISDAANGDTEDYNMDGAEGLFKSLFGNPPYGMDTVATDAGWVAYQAAVKIQLEAFILAVEPLEAYGALLDSGAPTPPEVNSGDTSTKALMAGLVRFITFSLDVDGGLETSGTPYVSGIENNDLNALAYFIADPDTTVSLAPPPNVYLYQYSRLPVPVPPEEDGVEFYLKEPVLGNDYLLQVVNNGIDISELLDE